MALKDWSTTAASNATVGSISWAEGQTPGSVNDSARAEMADVRTWYENTEWRDWGHSVTRTADTTFTIAADVTAIYTANRPIKCTDSSTLYGIVASSSYAAPNTTVTVTLDSGALSASLSAVALGWLDTGDPIHVNALRGTLPLGSGGTGATTAATARAALVTEGPAFAGYLSGDQSVTVNVATKVAIDTEDFDTDSDYDASTNYRFTPQQAGYYLITGQIAMDAVGVDDGYVAIYKNGSEYIRCWVAGSTSGTSRASATVSALISLNGSTDYVELWGMAGEIGHGFESSNRQTYFSGVFIRN